MQKFNLNDMKGGWFVGRFQPTCLPLAECEVAIKHYRAGDSEAPHVHRVATELTAIAQGRVEINGTIFAAGDIAVLEPNEPAKFRVIEDTITVVVKAPSVPNDKYPV
jgi:hypothetical protein